MFEERMSSVFGGAENTPSADQINMTFQKMAGKCEVDFTGGWRSSD